MSVAIPAAADTPLAGCCRIERPARLRQTGVTETERNFSIAMHLSPLAAFLFALAIFVPLVVWLVRKDESAFNDDHGRELINALVSFFLYHLVAAVTVIGLLALPVLYVVGIISLIHGAIAAGRGEYFRYPMTIRFL